MLMSEIKIKNWLCGEQGRLLLGGIFLSPSLFGESPLALLIANLFDDEPKISVVAVSQRGEFMCGEES